MVGEDYIHWLCDRYGDRTFYGLFRFLAKKDYIWQMKLDENRAMSGLSLRETYAFEVGVYQYDAADGPCSVLEMLCALAEQMSMSVDVIDSPNYFLRELLTNLGILPVLPSQDKCTYILDKWLNRQYDSDGKGSIFYIRNCNHDLRTMDTWSQMNLYLNNRYPFDENFLKE